MSKVPYVDHVIDRIYEGKFWSGCNPVTPHWLWGDLRIEGDTEENPVTRTHESWTLTYKHRVFHEPDVYVTRWKCSHDQNDILGRHTGSTIKITKTERHKLIDLIPLIQLTLEEKIVEQNRITDEKAEKLRWWP